MLRSSLCHLSDCTPSERIDRGECEHDHGGYFLIKSKEKVSEKVLIAQQRNIYNKVLVHKEKPDTKIKYLADIRSMSEETGHSVVVQGILGTDEKTLTFSLPYVKTHIPMGIVFKALGFLEDEQIKNFINLRTKKAQKYIKIILRDAYFIKSREDALIYIGQYTMHARKDHEIIKYVKQTVEKELFPHLGVTASLREKAFFLGHIIHKLLSVELNMRSIDDRDNYMNKRVECAGILCAELFRTLFKSLLSDIKNNLEKKKQRPDIISILSRFKHKLTSGLISSFATGKWGVQKNSYIRLGVSQVLSRLSYAAYLSHLRRIMLQTGKESKNSQIRQINPSQIGFICPVDTPEGKSVGVVLNMSLLTNISQRTSTVFVREVLENINCMVPVNTFEGIFETKIFHNGTLLGFTEDVNEFLSEVKHARFNKLLPLDVSINYNDIDDEINIYSDEGRLLRPLFTVDGDKLKIKESDGIDWDTLVDKGLIQYVDNSEVDNSVIAFKQEELKKYSNDYCEIAPAMILGVMANNIPFPDHSQAPRNTYQSSMGKQAMGMFALSHQIRTDTVVNILEYTQRPLVSTRPAEMMGFNDMPAGLNAIVAVACYTGHNQEDSIILSKGAVERGLFLASTYRNHSEEERKQGTYNFEKIALPSENIRRQDVNYCLLNKTGVVRVKSYVQQGDVIIGKVFIRTDKKGGEEKSDCSLVIKKGEEGYVEKIFESTNPNGYRLVKIKIRKLRIPEEGDKFASKSAQKGTVGMICPHEDLPFTGSGITPDIIINSHCIPSRMTINQLMECVLGKGCLMNGKYGDATPFTSASDNVSEKICDSLHKEGFERHGNEMMYNGMTGEPLEAQIFIGPTYYQRLKHNVSDKIHARAQGHVTTLLRQPLEGRSRDGGLRFGEMERDCIIGHGTARFLKERLYDQSDPYQIIVCNQCGMVATTQNKCRGCDTDDVSKVNMPYASKLLFQELNAMMIKTTINVKSIVH
jgi:DNA-directed RNA polymerase II subunit RPB2